MILKYSFPKLIKKNIYAIFADQIILALLF